jgi:hypothetical protein
MFDLKGKHEHVFLSILNKYIFSLIKSVKILFLNTSYLSFANIYSLD